MTLIRSIEFFKRTASRFLFSSIYNRISIHLRSKEIYCIENMNLFKVFGTFVISLPFDVWRLPITMWCANRRLNTVILMHEIWFEFRGFAFTTIDLFTNYRFNLAWLIVNEIQITVLKLRPERRRKKNKATDEEWRSRQLSISINRSLLLNKILCCWNACEQLKCGTNLFILMEKPADLIYLLFRLRAYENGRFSIDDGDNVWKI